MKKFSFSCLFENQVNAHLPKVNGTISLEILNLFKTIFYWNLMHEIIDLKILIKKSCERLGNE